MKIGVIIQARMGSTRLSGKVMKKIEGKTVLDHVIERVKQSKKIDEIIVATTTKNSDSVIEKEALRCGVKSFRGSEEDVLSRYYHAAKENELDIVIRITSDCPLIDPNIMDYMIEEYLQNDYDMLSNGGITPKERSFPRGLDIAIFNFDVLEEAFLNAEKDYEREHVAPYIYENKVVSYYKNNNDLSDNRWTLDTYEDLKFIEEVYKSLYKGRHNFYMKDIIKLINERPELKAINSHVEQKSH